MALVISMGAYGLRRFKFAARPAKIEGAAPLGAGQAAPVRGVQIRPAAAGEGRFASVVLVPPHGLA